MYSCSVLRPARMFWNEIWRCTDEQVRHDNDVLSSPVEIVVMKPITRVKRLIVGWELARHMCGCHASSVCADNRCSGIVVRLDFLVKWLPLSVLVMFGRSQVQISVVRRLPWWVSHVVCSLPPGYNRKVPKINPLKTKLRPLYLKTQSVPRCKHFSSGL